MIASASSRARTLPRRGLVRNMLLAILVKGGVLSLTLDGQTPTDGSVAQELKRRNGEDGLALIQIQSNFLELLSFDGEMQSLPNPRGASNAWFSSNGKAVAWNIYTLPSKRFSACPWPVIAEVLNQPGEWQLPGNVINARSMAVSSNGRQVAFNGTYKPSGTFRITPQNRARWVTGLQYVDSKSQAVKLILPLPEGSHRVTSISFSPDGTHFAYDYENKIYVYDTAGGTSRTVAAGASPTWSPNGKWIAFRSEDREARTINGVTFEEETIVGRRKMMHSVLWSPDSRYVAIVEPLGPISNLLHGRDPFTPAQMVVERIDDHATAIVHRFQSEGTDPSGFYWIPDYRAFMRVASNFPTIKACDESE